MKTSRIIVLAALVVLGLAALLAVRGALAAPVEAKHQVIAALRLRQYTNEAQLELSTVDAGPLKHIGRKVIQRGIILADDAGRMIGLRGDVAEIWHDRHAQEFRFTDLHIDLPGLKVIRVTHISLMVFSGDDWQHPWETSICGSPSLSIDACLAQWHPE